MQNIVGNENYEVIKSQWQDMNRVCEKKSVKIEY